MKQVLVVLAFVVATLASQSHHPGLDTANCTDFHLPQYEEHVALAKKHLIRAHSRNSVKPVMGGHRSAELHKYTSSFLQLSGPTGTRPGIFQEAGAHLGQIAVSYNRNNNKWSYGHCVCEVCHNIMEQLQVKMFSDYGYDFTDDDIHDVLEDSFCDSVLPYYRSPCQYILSYRYHSLASMIMYMIPYDICQTQRMCMGTTYSPLSARTN